MARRHAGDTPSPPDSFRVGDALHQAEALIRSAIELLDEAEHILNQTEERLSQAGFMRILHDSDDRQIRTELNGCSPHR